MYTIKNIVDVKRLLKKENIKIFAIGATPSTHHEFHLFADDFEIIHTKKTGELKSISNKIKTKYIPVKISSLLPANSQTKILQDKRTINYINKNSKGKLVAILVTTPTPEILEVCKKNDWFFIGNNPEISGQYDSKAVFQDLLQKIGVNSSAITIKLSELEENVDYLFDKLGNKIAIQLPDNGGGRGALFFTKKKKHRVVPKVTRRASTISKVDMETVLITVNKFFNGDAVSSSATITKENGIIYSSVQHQLIDIPESVFAKKNGSGVFCGHDWVLSKNIPNNIHIQAKEMTQLIGERLAASGILGMFGVDFILDTETNSLIPLETNVRLTGVLPTMSYIEYEHNLIPLTALHALDLLGIDYKLEQDKAERIESNTTHLWLYNPTRFRMKNKKTIHGGVYTILNNKIKFLRDGFSILDIKNGDEFVLSENIPTKKIIFRKNRRFLRILTKKQIAKNSYELNDFGKEITKAILAEIDAHKVFILKSKILKFIVRIFQKAMS